MILKSDAYDQWLDASTSVDASRDLLGHNLGDDLEYFRVGRAVNSSKQDKADYILPLAIGDTSSDA